MGHGASTLSDAQKACITKEMKEKYESISAEDTEAQAELMKHYMEVVTKVQNEEGGASAGGSSLPAGKKKKKMSRKRSFDNSMFLNAVHALPGKDEEQDYWDSVRTQPTCIICKMVFTTDSKMDTHTKYSEVHRKNVEALAALENHTSDSTDQVEQKESQTVDDSTKAELPSFRCRELYSGSKLYWRLQDTIEYNLYLHLESNTVEAIPYDYHAQVQYGRLYFDENAAHTLVGSAKIAESVKERLLEFEKAGKELPNEKDVVADERRQAVVSLLMSKLQLVKDDDGKKVVSFNINLKDGEVSPLLKKKPDSVTPVLINRRRLSTGQEIEAALQQATDLEAKINESLHVAEDLEVKAHVE